MKFDTHPAKLTPSSIYLSLLAATILQETTALHEELIKDEVDFDEDTVYVCVYDPVVKLINRHNEVHVVKKGEEPSKHTRGYITAN